MKAVLFDLWETLVIDPPDLARARALWRAANVRAVYETAGLEASFDDLDDALTLTSRALSALHDAGEDVDARGRVDLFAAQIAAAIGQAPPPETFEALEAAICTMTPGLYPHRAPHALETLAAVKAEGLRTCLVSNAGTTTAPTLREMLEHYGLAEHLDALLFSDDLRLAKPSPAIFAAALEATGCAASEAVFIGDSAIHDVAGARATGIYAVQIGGTRVEGHEADAHISTLAELPRLLAAL